MLARTNTELMRPAIVIMAKAPRAGRVKTRLAPLLTPAESAELAARFFVDAASAARSLAPDLVVAYSPPDGRASLEPLLEGRERARWLEQCDGDLGARLHAAFRHAATERFSPVVVIGTDSPTLPLSHLLAARDALARREADLALGPTEDGGYYTVALRRPAPGLFDGVEWSTPRAFEQTARNAARLDLRTLVLPAWYDVDTPADLLRLRDELFDDEDAQRRAPSTYEWLRGRLLA